MKYIYKQILAFLIVIGITAGILGFTFINFMTETIYQEQEDRLFGYAQSIINQNMSLQDIEAGTDLVTNQDVIIGIYDEQDTLVYPYTEGKYSSGLSKEEFQLLQEGQQISLQRRERGFMDENFSILTVYLPLFNSTTSEFAGFIAVGSHVSDVQEQISAIQKNIVTAVLISLGVAIFIALGLANYMSKRIVRMRKATHEISQGNFDIALENHGKDEFDELSRDFNKMAESLKASNEEIERQENLRRQFMLDVAHEMRTPLTTINGILEGLQHNMIPESHQPRSLELMQKEARRMIRLVNENLDYEKIRSNQIVLVKQEFNAVEALESVKEQLQQKARSKGDVIEVIHHGEYVPIYADYDRFVQIVVNLAQNAIQFTDNGLIRLEAAFDDEETRVTVTDNGIGISEKDIKSIWERFYKADVSRKNTKFGESGIGLAIVHSLVSSHQGRIDVRSTEGKGTTFELILPRKEHAEEQAKALPPEEGRVSKIGK